MGRDVLINATSGKGARLNLQNRSKIMANFLQLKDERLLTTPQQKQFWEES
jgi:hypothetical protein